MKVLLFTLLISFNCLSNSPTYYVTVNPELQTIEQCTIYTQDEFMGSDLTGYIDALDWCSSEWEVMNEFYHVEGYENITYPIVLD